MAAINNTFQTYEAEGIPEQLTNVIYNISPEDTPYSSNISRGKTTTTFKEWQEDELAAPDTNNAVPMGDDVQNFDAVVPTERRGNYTQISRKTVIIADTLEAVDKKGRKSELAYQLAKKGAELKRDIEAILLSNQGAQAAAAGVAGKTASVIAFIKTNVDHEATGANPVYSEVPTQARTDGALRPFTEDMLKSMVAACWEQGANPTTVMVGSKNKQTVSGFEGIATRTLQQTGAKVTAIIGAADIYVSDFGKLSIVPNRFQRTRDALFLDFSYIELDFLRPIKQVPLAKTGDAEKRMLICEYLHKVNTEKALGLVTDLAA